MTKSKAAPDLEASIARNALKYDLLPYESKPFAQSQPARLGAIAKLFNLDCAPMENARVLELGCAAGGNIIPHAMRYPKAKFVGVDLARTQVAAGRTRIARLGLKNIEIHCKSITEIGDELGEFDYIICHGVFSWVPAEVQDAIFRVIRDRMSPKGLACVSYNVLPGWRIIQPLRDAFLMQIPEGGDPLARVANARTLITFLKEATPDNGPYGDMLRQWADRLGSLPEDYIAHEFLEECNLPCTIKSFTGSAAQHGLGYLGECELPSMLLANYGTKVAEQLPQIVGNDLIETEQFIDLLSGRTFRQSILVASERMEKVDRNLSAERIAKLHFLPPGGLQMEEKDGAYVFSDSQGRTLTTSVKGVRDGLARMIAQHPASSTLEQCAKGEKAEIATAICDALQQMAMIGMIQLLTEPVEAAAKASDKPAAIKLARDDALVGSTYTTNRRHETVTLDPTAQILLPILDGTRTAQALEIELFAATKMGRLNFQRDGKEVTENAELKSLIAEHVPNLLSSIASAALLDA